MADNTIPDQVDYAAATHALNHIQKSLLYFYRLICSTTASSTTTVTKQVDSSPERPGKTPISPPGAGAATDAATSTTTTVVPLPIPPPLKTIVPYGIPERSSTIVFDSSSVSLENILISYLSHRPPPSSEVIVPSPSFHMGSLNNTESGTATESFLFEFFATYNPNNVAADVNSLFDTNLPLAEVVNCSTIKQLFDYSLYVERDGCANNNRDSQMIFFSEAKSRQEFFNMTLESQAPFSVFEVFSFLTDMLKDHDKGTQFLQNTLDQWRESKKTDCDRIRRKFVSMGAAGYSHLQRMHSDRYNTLDKVAASNAIASGSKPGFEQNCNTTVLQAVQTMIEPSSGEDLYTAILPVLTPLFDSRTLVFCNLNLCQLLAYTILNCRGTTASSATRPQHPTSGSSIHGGSVAGSSITTPSMAVGAPLLLLPSQTGNSSIYDPMFNCLKMCQKHCESIDQMMTVNLNSSFATLLDAIVANKRWGLVPVVLKSSKGEDRRNQNDLTTVIEKFLYLSRGYLSEDAETTIAVITPADVLVVVSNHFSQNQQLLVPEPLVDPTSSPTESVTSSGFMQQPIPSSAFIDTLSNCCVADLFPDLIVDYISPIVNGIILNEVALLETELNSMQGEIDITIDEIGNDATEHQQQEQATQSLSPGSSLNKLLVARIENLRQLLRPVSNNLLVIYSNELPIALKDVVKRFLTNIRIQQNSGCGLKTCAGFLIVDVQSLRASKFLSIRDLWKFILNGCDAAYQSTILNLAAVQQQYLLSASQQVRAQTSPPHSEMI